MESASSLAVYQDDCNLVGVFDIFLHDFGVLATCVSIERRFLWVGYFLENLNGSAQPDHGIRIQGVENQYVAFCTPIN